MCPGPPAGGLTTSWAACSVGLDPTKQGGDLLWTLAAALPDLSCAPSADAYTVELALGPTGDVAVGSLCSGYVGDESLAISFNGSGNYLQNYTLGGYGGCSQILGIDRNHDLVVISEWPEQLQDDDATAAVIGPGGSSFSWSVSGYSSFGLPPLLGPTWDSDAFGNFFLLGNAGGVTLLSSTPTLPGAGTELLRGGAMGESYQGNFSGSFVADQTGGVYRFDALASTLDLGCGPMVPVSAASAYLARIGPTWGCVYSRVLPASVSVLADTSGNATLVASSTSSLDLGCGALAAAAGGSTFVTRLDAAGSCVFGRSLPAPGLTVALDPTGNVVVSGLVGATAVDLGEGPLAPLGSEDFVLAELDASGNPLWSRRFGGVGITFASPSVSTSAAGDVYLLTGWSGAVDLGGGPLSAATGDTVVGSFSSSGAPRWSRGFQFPAGAQVGIDGCGALVVATETNFNPGCGNILPPNPVAFDGVPYIAVARFAP